MTTITHTSVQSVVIKIVFLLITFTNQKRTLRDAIKEESEDKNMKKYKILFDGEFEDEEFDSEEAADDYALYLVSCSRSGAEILNMSNPGDYPLDDFDEPEYEIVEVDE
jgi:hypothetical protein